MISTLPSEIIVKIATYLSQKEQTTFLRVCRSWYTALIPMLYNNVNIQTETRLNQFVETLQSTETSKLLGHHVRSIMVKTFMIPYKIASLRRLCPFVVELSWETYEWNSDLAEVLQEWKHLERVKRITFHEDGLKFPPRALQDKITVLSINIGIHPEWIDYITKLPGIKELELTHVPYDIENDSSKVSLDELELLHQALPCLETFSIDSIIIQGEMPEHVTPCSNVRSLSLEAIAGHLWGQYFAKKYTNLEKLLMHELLNETEADSEEIFKTQAMTLARSCRRIKSLTTSGYSYSRGDPPFFEVFQQIGAAIEHLNMICCDPPLHAAVIERFCGTLSRVSLTFSSMTFNEIVEPLKSCLLLVELELDDDSSEVYAEKAVKVDRILDYWIRLKHLRLIRCDIRLSDDCTTTNQHGLRALYLGERINQDVFPYLSQRCTRLSELGINFGYKIHPPSVIYIPNSNIEQLSVESLELKDYFYKLTWIDKSEQTSEQRKHFAEEVLKRRDQLAWYSSMKWLRSDEDDYYFSSYDLGGLDTFLDMQCRGCRMCGKSESDVYGRHVVWIQCYNVDAVFLLDSCASY